MVRQKYFREGAKICFLWAKKYTKYNKINNNLENFRREGKIVARESLPPNPL